ncbi:DUF1538 domain-containing protein [Feifania hominis]|uniref:DUF1538 domain-containing protein n=1 Tax=Feifania hominis TaxID=2763660 RepID=A0A926HUR9_9FIRM|nr:DUF1538 domain-containing protein [Feifania hominis]MBC8535851.1 DUF1538 domain-containing protein [Feifania hominis]
MNQRLLAKIKESLASVAPITALVLLLHFTVAPLGTGTLALFAVGAVMLVLGMGLFTLGADVAMMPMGERVGATLTKSRSLPLLICVGFVMGTVITLAEPDLQVLARQVPAVPDRVLIWTVAVGVGLFLVAALLRIVFQKRLSYVLLALYAVVFGLAIFSNGDFLAVAFDSGGVTTGPITVPFIMALGIGVAAVRGGASAEDDSFGLVALCSVGPILAVLALGMFYDSSSGSYAPTPLPAVENLGEALKLFGQELPHYAREVGVALLPIVGFFILFQVIKLRLPKTQMIKMCVGIVYTYVGLVLFLTGVNVGFMPAGSELGGLIASLDARWLLIPIGMVIGFFIVTAEPAVHVLNKQVEEITGGTITRRAMLLTLSIGVAVSIGLAMMRVLTGIGIWYCIVPGYLIALGLTFFVPRIFTAVAFDSGGVASGPMTATFLLPFAMGACEALGGNVLTDAFGIVAMVAMTPLIAIQILGVIYVCKAKRNPAPEHREEEPEIIELQTGGTTNDTD